MDVDFVKFPKIPRLFRDCTITEKIDGANAQVQIWNAEVEPCFGYCESLQHDGIWYGLRAASRNRWITPDDDNHGFALWVRENASELVKLGVGRHFGEWWGHGINRGYGLSRGERRFSLFNAGKWADGTIRPACCDVVPVLYQGPFMEDAIDATLEALREHGSYAPYWHEQPFMNPEGIVLYHHAANSMFKATLERDAIPKNLKAA